MNTTGSPAEPSPRAAEVSAGLERLLGLARRLSPPGLSLTAAATMATLERSGPLRLTALAAGEGVSQPAMTQLVARLEGQGLVTRCADPLDGRAVHVAITDAGRDLVAGRRAVRAQRLSVLLTELSPADQDALAAALPAITALARAHQSEQSSTAGGLAAGGLAAGGLAAGGLEQQ